MQESSIELIGRGGKLNTVGIKPTGSPVARVAIFHGYGDHAGRYAELMRFLALHDVQCAAVDFRGHGRSDGKRGFVRRWDEFLDDADVLIDHLGAGSPDAPLFILGHSHGGLVAATGLTFGRFKGVRGTILVSPFLRPKLVVPFHKRILASVGNVCFPSLKVSTGLGNGMMTHDQAMREDSSRDKLLNRCATPRWFVSTLATQERLFERANDFATPHLMLLGGGDVISDVQQASIFSAFSGATDKTVKTFPDLRHELLRETERQHFFDLISNWILSRREGV